MINNEFTKNIPLLPKLIQSADSEAMPVTAFSPDALLEYCSEQMNGLDGQINTLMKQQETQVNQEQAVEGVDTALEAYGTAGPGSWNDLSTCINAFSQAIASLPSGDPVAGKLQTQLNTMESQYGNCQDNFRTPATGAWQATTDNLNNLASNIKGNAQLQMMTLQDLVSQQQDAVEQCTQMMTSVNNTLLDQAKAIGQ